MCGKPHAAALHCADPPIFLDVSLEQQTAARLLGPWFSLHSNVLREVVPRSSSEGLGTPLKGLGLPPEVEDVLFGYWVGTGRPGPLAVAVGKKACL